MVFLAARADFGFGNPNLAGALFAMLAVGVWGFCGGRSDEARPSRFWMCLAVSAGFGALLVMTASRGAIVALGAGLLALWWVAEWPRPRRWQVGGLVVAVVLLSLLAAFGRMGERVAESSTEDGSITSRLAIFRAVPAMLAASPQGWGRGQSAEAYQNWFQAEEDARAYKHLLSSHATWMVERGWGFRFVYILVWLAVLMVCGKSPASFGVWVAFGTAGLFSHVGGDWRLWVGPVLALGLALWERARRMEWPGCRSWRNAMLAGLGLTLLLNVVGHEANEGIFHGRGFVKVGRGEPKKWFFAPDRAVLGAAYGKMVREEESAGVASHIETIVKAAPLEVVLSGRASVPEMATFPPPYDLVWLNPPAKLDHAQRRVVVEAAKKTIVWGELRTDANPRELKMWIETLPDGRWVDVRGSGQLLKRGMLGETGEFTQELH